jgi:hypothetical protein
MDVIAGLRLGGAEVQDPEELLSNAVGVAKDADAVIAIVGLNADWYGSLHLLFRVALMRHGYKGVRRLRPYYTGFTWGYE